MSKILLVLKNELVRVIFRRSFILMLFLLPLVSSGVFLTVSYLKGREAAQPGGAAQSATVVEGYVDLSGVVKTLPEQAKDTLRPYASEAEARSALQAGKISAFYVVSKDYLESGRIYYYRPDFNPLSNKSQSDEFEYALMYNLVGQNQVLASRIEQPLSRLVREVQAQAGQPQRDTDDMLTFFLPYGVTMLFYIVIFGSASLLLNSITDEKQNRVMEILMTSLTPAQLLSGKIIALGIAGLLQTVVWSLTGFVLLRLGKQTFQIPDSFQLPPSILAWGVVFFLLGYALYASLMAGVGALVPNLREASQATMVLVLPLILPLMLISLLANQPNGLVSVVLSLFPLTSPVAMMTRLSAASVPVWQLLAAVVLLIATAYLTLRAAAGMFRAQNLLSGRSFNMKLFFQALIGRM